MSENSRAVHLWVRDREPERETHRVTQRARARTRQTERERERQGQKQSRKKKLARDREKDREGGWKSVLFFACVRMCVKCGDMVWEGECRRSSS